tara:strand:+ start:269 stop:802 length:534 start_codon:yes stop_codon:yes gene_type:complete
MNIYKQLSAFQKECPIIHKGTKGYGYTYADLPSIFSTINPLLEKHDLGFTQLVNENGIKTIVYTTNTEEPQTIESVTPIPSDVSLKGMNEFQVLGSAITYIRRYALSSILGVITDKDTDAGGVQLPKKQESKLPVLKLGSDEYKKVKSALDSGKFTIAQVKTKYEVSVEIEKSLTIK